MTETPPDDQDPREKFKAALEAKKHKSGYGSHAHTTDEGSGKDHSSRTGGKREFRRKSGG